MLNNESGQPPGGFGNQVEKALALISGVDGAANLDEHVRWELKEVLSRLRYADLTTSEILALLAILCPAHSRVIRLRANVGVDNAAVLKLIRD